jgi:hypothetical protein
MPKKRKEIRQDTRVERSRGRLPRKKARNRNLVIIIALSSILVIAAVIGIVFYKMKNHAQSTGVASGYTISGTVRYSGSQKPGRTYLQLVESSGEFNGLGTSIESPRGFTIRGVPTGNYVINVWMDNSSPQTGIPNALSPKGSISVSVNNGNISEQNITILDPAQTPASNPPTNVRIAPGNGSALIQWNPPQDAKGNILSDHYNVYFNTSKSVSPQNGFKKTVQTNNSIFISGLDNGATYYFVVTAVLGEVETSPSAPAVSATIGAGTDSNTISGVVSFPVIAKGPMYAGVSGQNGFFFTRINAPVSPQPFSISGVQDGNYFYFVFIDMNNNGTVDTGDLNKTNNNPSSGNTEIFVSGNMTGIDRTLLNSNVVARVVTVHLGSESSTGRDDYSLQFELVGNIKLPVNVSLNSGGTSSSLTDLSGFYNYYHIFRSVSVKPKVGDSYIFNVTYSDGTSEKVNVSVTAVLDSFAKDLTTIGENRNIPIFQWSAPDSPPSDYTYLIQVGQRNIGREWTYPLNGIGMPSSQTAVLYNVDGSASLTSLQSGTQYDWLIFVIDSNGNQAIYGSDYTPR